MVSREILLRLTFSRKKVGSKHTYPFPSTDLWSKRIYQAADNGERGWPAGRFIPGYGITIRTWQAGYPPYSDTFKIDEDIDRS